MSEFRDSDWTDAGFVAEFLEAADREVPQRQRMFELTISYYKHFLGGRSRNSVLDLGCGDGNLVRRLLSADDTISAVLVDGSADMLKKARDSLAGRDRIRFINTSFEEMIRSRVELGPFDFVVSSLAIHHLGPSDKRALFDQIFRSLRQGGHFVNIDGVLPPTTPLEDWYVGLWEAWVRDHCEGPQLSEGLDLIYAHHQAKAHHDRLETLDHQLESMRAVGFEDVDVIFKDGIFAIYCGRRP